MPGFDVTKYAEMQAPGAFAFSPDGVLYVVPIQSFTKIYRIGPGGSPVEQYGDTALGDSFFRGIAFDASGAIGGVAGSVLVGDGSDLLAVLPDQTTVPLLSIPEPDKIIELAFDRATRLLVTSSGATAEFAMWVTTGDTLTPCTNGFGGMTVDGANRIYFGFFTGQVSVKTPDCTQLPDLLPEDDIGIFGGLAFGPYNAVWKGELFASARSTVYRITADGAIMPFGTGFDLTSMLAFGPDGALYVTDRDGNAIYRISPADVQQVSIDIKPDSDKNPVSPSSKGKLKVAILTTDDFDASTVDAGSVQFGPSEAEPLWYRLDDVDYDGDLDLVLKFNTQETGIACGDTEATLTGETFGGQSITGADSIKTVGCKPKKHHKKEHHKHHDKKYHKMNHNKHHDDEDDH